jgi:hypothetical protein
VGGGRWLSGDILPSGRSAREGAAMFMPIGCTTSRSLPITASAASDSGAATIAF